VACPGVCVGVAVGGNAVAVGSGVAVAVGSAGGLVGVASVATRANESSSAAESAPQASSATVSSATDAAARSRGIAVIGRWRPRLLSIVANYASWRPPDFNRLPVLDSGAPRG
jgi:hypothetical protein